MGATDLWATARAGRVVRSTFDKRVWSIVQKVPRGRVTSYRDVAALAGSPLAARIVAGALKRGKDLPWWRVLGADGSLRIMNPPLRREQQVRLEDEDVVVDGEGRVDMARFGWRPRSGACRTRWG